MSYSSGRQLLQIPGPTNVPDRVLRAIARPTIDHRSPEFSRLGREVLEGMKEIFKLLPSDIFPGSGTGPGKHRWSILYSWRQGFDVRDRQFAVRSQVASKTWSEIEMVQGDSPRRDPHSWKPNSAKIAVKITAVCVVQNETSTGVTSRVGELRKAMTCRHPALLLVDTISFDRSIFGWMNGALTSRSDALEGLDAAAWPWLQ
jgi:alanine-glyoxylate transaminase/serine-glyoxylate transaminase/serine-pyruvate transaminase